MTQAKKEEKSLNYGQSLLSVTLLDITPRCSLVGLSDLVEQLWLANVKLL